MPPASDLVDLAIVAVASGLVGVGEVCDRFRGEQVQALTKAPAIVYVLLNAVAGIVALLLIWGFDVQFGDQRSAETLRWTRVVLAGFSAAIVLRGSFFIRGDDGRGWGPGAMFDRFLNASMDAIRRSVGVERDEKVSECVTGLSYAEVRDSVVTLCFAMNNRAESDRVKEVREAVEDAERSDLDEQKKSLLIGHALHTFAGAKVLKRACEDVRNGSREAAKTTGPPVSSSAEAD